MMALARPAPSRPMTLPSQADRLASLTAELADIRRGYEARCPTTDDHHLREDVRVRALVPDPES